MNCKKCGEKVNYFEIEKNVPRKVYEGRMTCVCGYTQEFEAPFYTADIKGAQMELPPNQHRILLTTDK